MQEEKDVSFVQDPKTWYQQATLVNQIIIIMILVILESESGRGLSGPGPICL